MDVASALLTVIGGDPDISAAFGGRLYADQVPQSITATPMLVLWVVSEDAYETLGGALKLERARIEIDVLGRNRQEASMWRIKVRDRLNAFQRGIVNGLEIRGVCQATGGRFLTDRPEAGSQQYRFVSMQDFYVTYSTEL